MKSTRLAILLLALVPVCGTGCSTIITGGRKEVNFRSAPSGAHIVVSDEKGTPIYEGVTPTVVTLKTGKPYFVPRRYSVQVDKDGFEPMTFTLKSTVSGWYAGNLVFGGLVGLLIVDPLTGAMYTLPKETAVNLVPRAAASSSATEPALHVTDLASVPAALRSDLVRLE